jgi:hypothetical protein
MAQVVECLPSKQEALSLNLNTIPKNSTTKQTNKNNGLGLGMELTDRAHTEHNPRPLVSIPNKNDGLLILLAYYLLYFSSTTKMYLGDFLARKGTVLEDFFFFLFSVLGFELRA